MKAPHIVEAQAPAFAWIVTLDETSEGTQVDASRWPVVAWELSETSSGTLATPVLPNCLHVDNHVGLESDNGTIRWDGRQFDSYIDFASEVVASEWGCNATES